MSTKKSDQKISHKETEVVAKKREFMKKFGKYAVVGAGMTTVLMSDGWNGPILDSQPKRITSQP